MTEYLGNIYLILWGLSKERDCKNTKPTFAKKIKERLWYQTFPEIPSDYYLEGHNPITSLKIASSPIW